jgi:hypothetical protein
VIRDYWDANRSTMKIVDLDISEEGGVLRYTAIWRGNDGVSQQIIFDI